MRKRTFSSQTQDLFGFFVNTLVFKADFEPQQTFKGLVKQTRSNMLDAYANQDVPFEQLVDVLKVERDLAHPPLFQVAFIHQETPSGLPELTDISFESVESNQVIATDLFKSDTIRQMAEHYCNLLKNAVINPKKPIAEIDYLSTKEKQQLIFDWNSSQTQFEDEITVHNKFENVVNKNPEYCALCFNGTKLSYSMLNQKANQVAHHLIDLGVKKDDIIVVCCERSFEFYIYIFAVLKA